jgi:tRNA uridine 5-carbamoylmethylation protein Kti12
MQMPKLIMAKGLPGSGKTTWAWAEVLKSQGDLKRVSKDDLRAMMDAGSFSKVDEAFVVQARNRLAYQVLERGYSVIVDDTNLNPVHERNLVGIARSVGAVFAVKDFTGVDLETCIARDLQRAGAAGYVGRGAIESMYRKYLDRS